jgi:hypothetical protein
MAASYPVFPASSLRAIRFTHAILCLCLLAAYRISCLCYWILADPFRPSPPGKQARA